MPYRIAIHPDFIRHRNGEEQSYSARWVELASKEEDVDVFFVDAFSDSFFDELRRANGFMWRFGFDPVSLYSSKRLLAALSHALPIPTFPSLTDVWHFEDKISQHFLLRAANAPTPKTWIFWNRKDAIDFLRTAPYPLVLKLASGIQSKNVRLLKNFRDSRYWVNVMFGAGTDTLAQPPKLLQRILRDRITAFRILRGHGLPKGNQHGYFYVQEYIPDNTFDTRVTIIGNRAFAFRRLNRPNDFRASGSGLIDRSPEKIDPETIDLSWQIARRLHTQSLALDFIKRNGQNVVLEISYTYATWALRDCPGQWVFNSASFPHTPIWEDGQMRPEDLIFQNFLHDVRNDCTNRSRLD